MKTEKNTEDYEEKEINGWKYYRNPVHGRMVAYYRSVGEQLIFEKDEAFDRWLKAEEKEGN